MLRKIKQQVSQAVSAVNANGPRQEMLANEEGGSKGFLCPMCMSVFCDPDELKAHYATHSAQNRNDQATNSSTACENGQIGEEPFMMELEVKELKALIKDEKRYSSELKKQLDRLNEMITNQSTTPTDGEAFFVQQLLTAEGEKASVMQQVFELEKDISCMQRLNESLKQEKDEIVNKLGDVSQKMTKMADEIEDKQAEKTVLGDELVRYRKEIKMFEEKVEDLVAQLDQRPSEDDVKVLRQELIHAQQLMDKITLEKEEEIAEHVKTIDKLNIHQQENLYLIENLRHGFEQLREEKEKLEQGLTLRNTGMNENEKLREEICQHLEMNELLKAQLNDASSKIIHMEFLLEESRQGIQRSNVINESNVSKLTDLQKRLDQMCAEKMRYEEDIRRLEEEREHEIHEHSKALEKISTLQKSTNSEKDDLLEELSRYKDLLEKEKKVSTEKRIKIENQNNEIEAAHEEIRILRGKFYAENENLDENEKTAAFVKNDQAVQSDEIKCEKNAEDDEKLLADKADEINALKCECANWKKVADERNQLLEEKEKLVGFERNEIRQAVLKLSVMEEKAKMLEKGMVCAEEKQSKLKEELQNAVENLDLSQGQNTNLKVQLKHMKEEAAAILRETEILRNERDELKTDIKKSEKIADKLEAELKKQTAELNKNLAECSKLEKCLIEERETKDDASQQINLLSKQISLMENDFVVYHERTKDLFNKLEKAHSSTKKLEEMLIVQFEKLKSEFTYNVIENEKELEQCEDNESSLDDRLPELIGSLERRINGLSSVFEKIFQTFDKLSTKNLCYEKEMEEKQEFIDSLLVKSDKLKEELSVEKINGCTVAENFAQQENVLKNKIEMLQEENKELDDKINMHVASITSQEKFLESQKQEFEQNIKSMQESLENERQALSNVMKELEQQKIELGNLQTVIAEKDHVLGQMEIDYKQSLDKDKSHLIALEREKLNWIEEKKILQQKYLKVESDLEFERDRAAENKRRFDDALSAMHDLGRANQSLQVDVAKILNRKWLDDSEAKNCHLCLKAFSLTIRKHHCRQCGLIFCGNCTTHTAQVASHKNAVRVCSVCYDEISNR